MIRLAAIKHHGEAADPARFGLRKAEEAAQFHASIPEYEMTPLRALPALAGELGLGAISVKDESFRFGLNAFKALGGSFAMHKIADGREERLTFVTATDGNHGRGVAWAASRLGHEAYVYMPRGSSSERLENIRKLGAHAEILALSYDDTVRFAAEKAEQNGWVLIQDTSWKGYEEIPSYIMQGYTTMGYEIFRQLDEPPTHIFLQAGVGAMAGAMTSFFADVYRSPKPTIVIVEPDGANCIFRTAEADDGALHFCGDDMETIMAGLCCGEPCTVAWDILSCYADNFVSIPDSAAAKGMRVLGAPLPGDERIVSGESGASTVGFVIELMQKKELNELREMIKLDESSVVLCFSTEGDTDRENYRRIVWDGLYPSF